MTNLSSGPYGPFQFVPIFKALTSFFLPELFFLPEHIPSPRHIRPPLDCGKLVTCAAMRVSTRHFRKTFIVIEL